MAVATLRWTPSPTRPLWKESSVADVAETDPHRSLPQGILECWIGRLARRLAGRFRSGRPYAVKIATVTFRHRYSYLLWISRFISPVYHVASLELLRQSSSRLIPAVCVRLQGPRSIRSCYCAIRWCLTRAKQAAGINLYERHSRHRCMWSCLARPRLPTANPPGKSYAAPDQLGPVG
jgi:hypothetical protein